MLDKIALKFTELPKPLEFPGSGVTIFVGPNNSGKSLVLREIEQMFLAQEDYPRKILDRINIKWPSDVEFNEQLTLLDERKPPNSREGFVHLYRFQGPGSIESGGSDEEWLRAIFQNRSEHNERVFTTHFLRFFMIKLDGRTRFALTEDKDAGDLLAVPQNFLAKIFIDDQLRREIREIVCDAFGTYFVIDPLQGGRLRIRLSDSAPLSNEQSLDARARAFHAAAQHIKDASDGVQAFVGLVIAVFSGDYRMVLVDEPEAFLHPPLARKLGYRLAERTAARNGVLLASTHSPDFLYGCLQGASQVRIVRLDYSGGKSKGTLVDPIELRKFFATPLIRSSNVISGLFHDGVVVTESDNDRAFYSEIYHRLSEQDRRLPSMLFVNAQNKQTIRDIIGPLRAFGVPAAAIVDIDILKDGGETWTGWLKSARVPELSHAALSQNRASIKNAFEKAGKDMKRDSGISALSNDAPDAANSFFDALERYGIFVVRRGEMENWLPSLGAVGKKTDWTVSALEKLGSDPLGTTYVRPANDDVWEFMRGIVGWIKDPARKGTL